MAGNDLAQCALALGWLLSRCGPGEKDDAGD
jgi:hypothetical protein